MTIHEFEHCANICELDGGDVNVELTEKHGLELCMMIENYGELRTTHEERFFFLSREEAKELALFILEELGEEV